MITSEIILYSLLCSQKLC